MSHAIIEKFKEAESGAVTVDWVVITAAIVGLSAAVTGLVSSGVIGLSGSIGTLLADQTVSASAVSKSAAATVSKKTNTGPILLKMSQKQYKKYVAKVAKYDNKKIVKKLKKLLKYANVSANASSKSRKEHDEYLVVLAEATSRGLN